MPIELPPLVITLQPAGELSHEGEVITVIPTWVTNVPAAGPSASQSPILGLPEDIQENPSIQSLNPNNVSIFDPRPQDLGIPSSFQSTFAFVLGTQTLLPEHIITLAGSTSMLSNSQLTVRSGIPIYLDAQSKFVVVDGSSTIPVTPTPPSRSAPYVLTLDSKTYTADALGRFIVGTQTLLPGEYMMLDQVTTTLPDGRKTTSGGTLVYLDPQGTAVIVDGRTSSILQRAQPTEAVKLTVYNGETYTVPVTGAAMIVVGGLTVDIPGGRRTVLGGKTITLPAVDVGDQPGGLTTPQSRSAQFVDSQTSEVFTTRSTTVVESSAHKNAKTGGGRAIKVATGLEKRAALLLLALSISAISVQSWWFATRP
ncbi:hypothetical protein EK21DRAFT_117737 [Setomelanomma holmii]|uniref:Uncharacterized protein n=1 Tax=Setomelanomma holmii TaxID=210430 RepID=A0A9P4LHT9_9PLEO|nr:hypothetical protein EK21DRAFT_117737 [Setomelanomma holmii]